MDFITAVKTCFIEKYCCFEGRARRSEYWYFFLFNFVASFPIAFIPFVGKIWPLVVLLPSLGAAVRRLHDTGRSGWWLLLSIVPLANFVVIYFLVCDSQAEENKWGANPKA